MAFGMGSRLSGMPQATMSFPPNSFTPRGSNKDIDETILKVFSTFLPATSRIHIVTYNVHNQRPGEDLMNLLDIEGSSTSSSRDIDLYAICLQEAYSSGWIEAFSSLFVEMDYVKAKVRQMQGLLTMLFVHRNTLHHIKNFESEITRTGMGGYFGNKGSVSVRLDFRGMNIVFVNCHLAPHSDEIVARLLNVDTILDAQKFKDQDTDNIMDHDYIFWVGDLNFRIDGLDFEKVVKLTEEKKYKTILKNDQLNMVREEGLAFDGFFEADINFPPTYKFDPGTNLYDTSPKKRVPAYCDRILYYYHNTTYGHITLDVKPLDYRSHFSYMKSDHKPVTGTYEIAVMSKPLPQPVKFKLQTHKWFRNVNQTIDYEVKQPFTVTSSDWIGLFKSDFKTFKDYITYTWVSTIPILGSGKFKSYQAKLGYSGFDSVPSGDYCLCYMTKNYSLCGISKHIFII